MTSIPFADNFLAGSIISLLMPVGLLTAIAIWYLIAIRRVPKDTPESSSVLPPPEVVAAGPPSESTPADPPPGES